MKKLLALLLVLALAFSIIACSETAEDSSLPDQNGATEDAGGDTTTDSSGDDNIDDGEGNDSTNDGEGDDSTDGGEGDDSTDEGEGNDSTDNGEGDGSTDDGEGDGSTDEGEGDGNTDEDTACQSHKDADNNEKCDVCNESVVIILDFYTINDLHGKLLDNEKQPGVDELTTYLMNAWRYDDYSIVIANGDMWQGTSESNLTHGKIITEWLNYVGAVSMTLGNHEFDWVVDYIYENAEIANFPILAINIYDKTTNQRVDFASPSVIVERGGAKIGIIGAIGDCHSSISQDKVANLEFKVGKELAELVKAESDRLRALGCDFIVFSVHDGVAKYGESTIYDSEMSHYYDIALSSGYIDLVFESHTHYEYVMRDSKGVYHIQAGGDNRAISHVEIKLNFANDKSEIRIAETVGSFTYDDYASDSIVDLLTKKYESDIAKGNEKLGNIPSNVDGDTLRQVSMNLYLEKGLEKWGSKYSIVLSGGYVSVRSPGILYAGDVLYEDIYTLFPFDNGLYLCSISGKNLKQKFINSSNENYFICMSDYGKSITINDNATYYIISDAYSVFYAPNKLTIIEEYGEELYARDMLAEYVKNGGFGEASTPSGGTNFTSIPEIIAKADSLGANVESSESYWVIGTIIDDPNATYGNCTIMDAGGNTIYLYGLYSSDGTRYDGLANKPKKGDTIIVCGKAMLYVNANDPSDRKYELKGCVVSVAINTSDISDVLAIGNALSDNASTTDAYCVFGKVKDAPHEMYGNMTVVDANGDEIYVYGAYDSNGNIRYDSLSEKPKKGDTVVIFGYVKKYVKDGAAPLIEIERGMILLVYKADSGLVYYL